MVSLDDDALAERGTPSRLARLTRDLGLLAPFACLYASFGATYSLLGTGAPLVFRARGMPLGEIGWLQLISIPIGITFLWAPMLDGVRLFGLPHRIGWIAASQLAAAALLLALSRAIDGPLGVLFSLALAASVAVATMDVALEALVVDTVPRERRPSVTTVKLIGSSIGTMLGIALVTSFPQTIDLARATLILATADALLLLPILRYPEVARRLATRKPERSRASWSRLRTVLGRGAIIGVYFAPAIMLGSTPSLALLDLGVSLPAVGLITGPVTTVLTMAMMLLSGWALTRLAAHRLVLALAGGVAFGGVLFAGATTGHFAQLGIAAALLNVLFEAGLGVPVFNVMYRWSEGGHAAGDYALLFGTAFLVSFPMRVASPMLAAALGWPMFYALVVPLYGAAALVLAGAMRRSASSAA